MVRCGQCHVGVTEVHLNEVLTQVLGHDRALRILHQHSQREELRVTGPDVAFRALKLQKLYRILLVIRKITKAEMRERKMKARRRPWERVAVKVPGDTRNFALSIEMTGDEACRTVVLSDGSDKRVLETTISCRREQPYLAGEYWYDATCTTQALDASVDSCDTAVELWWKERDGSGEQEFVGNENKCSGFTLVCNGDAWKRF